MLTLVADCDTFVARLLGPQEPFVAIVKMTLVVFAAALSATILWNARRYAVHSG